MVKIHYNIINQQKRNKMSINYRIFREGKKSEILGGAKESLSECERILENLIKKNPGVQYRIEKIEKVFVKNVKEAIAICKTCYNYSAKKCRYCVCGGCQDWDFSKVEDMFEDKYKSKASCSRGLWVEK